MRFRAQQVRVMGLLGTHHIAYTNLSESAWQDGVGGSPACADVALEPDLAELELQVGVVEGHDVGVLLAQGAVAAGGGLLPALALPQMQPAPCHAILS